MVVRSLFARVLVASAVMSVSPVIAAPLLCSIDTKFFCSSNACTLVEASVWNVLDQAEGTYARCDRLGCDTYPAIFSLAAAVMLIDVPGRGLLAKLSVAGDFTEVSTLGNDVYLSFGRCPM